jgi:antibiotic biosynthesis monooxygenase (ABM) superfamily enzyme
LVRFGFVCGDVVVKPVYILASLWIREGLEVEFESYERKVSRIMARYDGVVERAIRPVRSASDEDDQPFEVHVLRFPTRDLYEAYRDDAERQTLSSERAAIIAATKVLIGMEGPTYAPRDS